MVDFSQDEIEKQLYYLYSLQIQIFHNVGLFPIYDLLCQEHMRKSVKINNQHEERFLKKFDDY